MSASSKSRESTRVSLLVSWVLAHQVLVFGLALALAVAAGYRTVLTYSDLRSDLDELLPDSAASVSALATLRERLPGLVHLGVVVDTGGSHNVPAATRFLDDLKAKIKTYPPGMVEAVSIDVDAEKRFLETYLLQLMDVEDVSALRAAVEERRDRSVAKALATDLLDEDEDEPQDAVETLVRQLTEKYELRYGKPPSFPEGRLIAQDGRTAVLVIRASSLNPNYDAAKQLSEAVRSSIRELGFPAAYEGSMRVGMAGDIATRVEELEGLVTDLSLSGVLVALLVVLSIAAYFRSFWALPVLALPLLFGSLFAFGLVALPPLSIRHLNSNTAFLGSIIVGNGINTGIILLARFREENEANVPFATAMSHAIMGTWKPTLAATLAASAAYGSLVFTDFRGFNQFGWIGGLGMLCCWLSTMLLAPVLICRWGTQLRRARPRVTQPRQGSWLDRLLGAPRALLFVTLALAFFSGLALLSRTDDWLEQDFSTLRRRDSWVNGERYWGKRMDDTLQRQLTPTVLLASNAESALAIEQAVRQLQQNGEAGNLIGTVRSAHTLLSSQRAEAVLEAKKLDQALTPRLRAELPQADRQRLERALSPEALRPLVADDIPDSLAAGLREYGGRVDRNVLVFAKPGSGTWEGERINAFTDDLRRVATSIDPEAKIAGSLVLSRDIANAMKADGPRASAIALAVVLTVTLIAFGSLGLSLIAMGSLLVGVLLMLGAMAMTGQKVNFCNFVTLPITFGIGADYAINMLKRFQASQGRELRAALTSTGGAVSLCSATTIIGFGSLLVAQNRALFSFGLFAMTGELTCLATAVLALPAALYLLHPTNAAAKPPESPVKPLDNAARSHRDSG